MMASERKSQSFVTFFIKSRHRRSESVLALALALGQQIQHHYGSVHKPYFRNIEQRQPFETLISSNRVYTKYSFTYLVNLQRGSFPISYICWQIHKNVLMEACRFFRSVRKLPIKACTARVTPTSTNACVNETLASFIA